MRVSVITINFNNRGGLEQTMKSVLNQSYPNLEYIVIDGGSNDGSKEVIESYSNLMAYCISEADKGIYDAMNKGLDKCTGQYILFMNSGDLFYENTTVEKFVALDRDEDFVYGDALITGRTPESLVKRMPDMLSIDNCLRFTITHQAIFHHKRVFESNRFDLTYSIIADWVFFNNALLLGGATYYHMTEIVAIYDGTGFSSDKQFIVQRELERNRFFESILPKYLKHKTDRKFEVKVISGKKTFFKRLKDKL